MAGAWWYAARAAARTGSWVARSSRQTAVNATNNRVSRGARQGILGPWDVAPPTRALQGGVWDYRGVARSSDITPARSDLPLGRFIDPRRWTPTSPFGLSLEVGNQHTLVVGPTRSGKTTSIVAPWIHAALRQGFSVVAVDVKGNDDLYKEVKRYSRAVGPAGASVAKWDYSDPTRSMSWNWITELSSDSQINAAVEAVCGRPNPSDPNRFFHQASMKYLRGLLELSGFMQNSSVESLLWILADQMRLEHLVDASPSSAGARRLSELVGLRPDEYLKMTSELTTHLETLDTRGFSAVTSRHGFEFEMLDGPSPALVVVSAPIADGELAASASGLFLGQLLQSVYSRFGRQGHRPLLLVLDEAARLQDRIDLGAALSLVASAGVSMLLAVQDLHQLRQDTREEVLANCGTVVCLPGVARTTTDAFSGRLGEMHVTSKIPGFSPGALGGGISWTHGHERAPLLSHREIASPHPLLGPWPAFVHSRSLSDRPIAVDLTRHDLNAP